MPLNTTKLNLPTETLAVPSPTFEGGAYMGHVRRYMRLNPMSSLRDASRAVMRTPTRMMHAVRSPMRRMY